jgi:3',5'-cyclic-AMP phosphodiesterase
LARWRAARVGALGRPFILAQLSDFHLGDDRDGRGDPAAALARVVAAVAGLPNPVDAVVVTGDLADHGTAAEYRLAQELLAPIGAPIYPLPGNNDDRAALRKAFGLAGEGDDPIDYAVDLGPLDLVVIDSTLPAKTRGAFEPAQLRHLDATLAANAGKPTVVAMHHPPLTTAIADWDRWNMRRGPRRAIAETIAAHPHVLAIVAGHLHRVVASTLVGRPVISGPSTFTQAHPDFRTETVEMLGGSPPGFALHALLGDELSSQIEAIR